MHDGDRVSHQRALGYAYAKACEEARETTCRCRCGGVWHGAKRTAYPETLAVDDPHYPAAEVASRERECRRLVRAMRRWYVRRVPYPVDAVAAVRARLGQVA